MSYNTQSEQIAFFNGNRPIPRSLPINSHPHREILGNSAEIYEAKQLERETLIHVMTDWVDKLSKQPKCVWESDKQRETLKELKRFRRNPEVAVPELKKSYYGCVYLIKQWDYLKQVVDAESFSGDFKTADETLILGLCEVPFWNRDQNFDFMPRVEMTPEEAHTHIGPFIQEKIDALRELAMARRSDEERDRELAIASPQVFPDKKLRGWTKELHKVERELIAIYTYVQSLQAPESKPVEAPEAEPTVSFAASLKKVEPLRTHTVTKAPTESLEVKPPAPVAPQVAKAEMSKPPQATRPPQPAQSQPSRNLNRKQARKLRFQEAQRRKKQKIVSDLIEQNFGKSNILDITIGKSWF